MTRKCRVCHVPINSGIKCASCFTTQRQTQRKILMSMPASASANIPAGPICPLCGKEFTPIHPADAICNACMVMLHFFLSGQHAQNHQHESESKEEATEMAIMSNKIVSPQKAFNEIHLLLCGLIKQYGKKVGDKYVIELKNEILEDAGFVLEQQRLSCHKNVADNTYMVTLTFACSDEEQQKQYITENIPWAEYMKRVAK